MLNSIPPETNDELKVERKDYEKYSKSLEREIAKLRTCIRHWMAGKGAEGRLCLDEANGIMQERENCDGT